MPGKSSRVWFDELVDVLEVEWRDTITMPELVSLTLRLEELLKEVRRKGGYTLPTMRCPDNEDHLMTAVIRVSVRGTIFAAVRFGLSDELTVKGIDRQWKRFRREQALDAYGEPNATALPDQYKLPHD
jgi:hypothetical protein